MPPRDRTTLRASFRHGLPTSPKMRRYQNEPLLSPSDLNDLLECRHLMALKLAAFRAEAGPSRPTARTPRSSPATASSTSRRSWKRSRRRPDRRARSGPAAREDESAPRRRADLGGDAPGRRGDPPGGARWRRRRRICRLPGARQPAFRPGRMELRRRRRQAGPHHQDLLPGAAVGLRGPSRSLQGEPPAELAVLLGDGRRDSYRTADFAAYVRALLRHAEQTIRQGRAETYPLPCGHCAICGYRHACEQRRRDDDHLSLVAGLRRDQVARLEVAGVTTLTALAELPEQPGAALPTRHAHQAAAPGGAPAARAHNREAVLRAARPTRPATASACSPSPRRATSSSTSRATPTSATRASSTCSASAGWTSAEGALPAVLGPRPRRGAAPFEVLVDFFIGWRARHPGCHIYHYAAIRGAGAEAARDVPRHPRGRGRRPASRRRPGRPLPRRPPGRAHLQGELLAEAGRGLLLARAPRPR